MRRQCELLGLPRSCWYYEPIPESESNLSLMRLIDETYLSHPYFGSRRMSEWLRQRGVTLNRKRTRRLMRLMGLEAIYPKPRTTMANAEHRIFPYLLRDLAIDRTDQVWSSDITYVPMHRGHLYLTAVMDWHSRYVLSWRLSNSLEGSFCIEAVEDALEWSCPEIFNTDQGSQFTSSSFVGLLESRGIRVSMDGKGRALDNVFIERLWRSVKYEEIYLKGYSNGLEAERNLAQYFRFYNDERPHQSLGYKTPAAIYARQRKSTKKSKVPKVAGR